MADRKLIQGDDNVALPAKVFVVPETDGGTKSKAVLKDTFRRVRKATDPWAARRELGRRGVKDRDVFGPRVQVELGSDYIYLKRTVQSSEVGGRTKPRSVTERARFGDVIVVDSLFNVTVLPTDVFHAIATTDREIVDE